MAHKDIPWTYEWERKIHFFAGWMVAYVYTYEDPKYVIIKPDCPKRKFYLLAGKDFLATAYVYEPELVKGSYKYLSSAAKRNMVATQKKNITILQQKFNTVVKKLHKANFSKLTNKEFANLFEGFIKIYLSAGLLIGQIRYTNWGSEQWFHDHLQNIVPQEQLNEVTNILASTIEESALSRMEKDLYIHVKRTQKGNWQREVKKYWNKYKWTQCGYDDEDPLDLKEIEKKFKEANKHFSYLEVKIKQEYQSRQLIKKNRDKILRQYKFSRNVRAVADFISACTYYKDVLRFFHNKFHFELKPIFAEVGNRLSIPYRNVLALSPDEIIQGLQGKKFPSEEERTNRKTAFVFLVRNSHVNIFTGTKALPYLDELKASETQNTELKGTVANKGHVTGKVVVVKSLAEARQKKVKGCIFITTMTTPDLMPFLRHVKAIVTDEGGITSHAAIVSREMGIPCVIGTKVATRVLNDGDLVEVDANKGMVRKL
jgi:phosphohistidine swiveling domain-containing protein